MKIDGVIKKNLKDVAVGAMVDLAFHNWANNEIDKLCKVRKAEDLKMDIDNECRNSVWGMVVVALSITLGFVMSSIINNDPTILSENWAWPVATIVVILLTGYLLDKAGIIRLLEGD